MNDPDCKDCTVVETEFLADGFLMRLLRGILQTLVEGAAAYGAGLHGYPSVGYPPGNTAEQRMSRFWPGQ